MGNIQYTPDQYASNSYNSFIKLFSSGGGLKKFGLVKDFQSYIDYEFGIFLEDFIVNDEEFQKYTTQEKKICVGCICFYHSSTPYNAKTYSEIISNIPIFANTIGKLYNDSTPPVKVLDGYFTSKYTWDGSLFYKSSGSEWIPCLEEELSCDGFIKESGIDCIIRSCDCNSDFVRDAINEFSNYCKSLLKAAQTYDGSPDYTLAISSIKDLAKKFNIANNKIPCKSGPVNISKGSQRNYKLSDLFTVKLNYDPSKDVTDLVSKFLDNVTCDNKILATHMVRCGASVKRTLTIVSGPKQSGKSTILALSSALYGPYACTMADHVGNNVNYELVRTCCIDDPSFINETAVSSHPCDHLVVSCENTDIGETYGGRQVKHLVLSGSIDEDDVILDVITKLSTRKQLASLLGWCLTNYDPNPFRISRAPDNDIFSMLNSLRNYSHSDIDPMESISEPHD